MAFHPIVQGESALHLYHCHQSAGLDQPQNRRRFYFALGGERVGHGVNVWINALEHLDPNKGTDFYFKGVVEVVDKTDDFPEAFGYYTSTRRRGHIAIGEKLDPRKALIQAHAHRMHESGRYTEDIATWVRDECAKLRLGKGTPKQLMEQIGLEYFPRSGRTIVTTPSI